MSVMQGILEMPRVAYSLVRWSDGIQREGHSQERQEGFAERWCRENNVRLDDEKSMVLDGESAFRGQHRRHGRRKVRALADFLDAVRARTVCKGSILIMENIDRLSREDIDEAYQFFRSILMAGVDVVTEAPLRHYTKESLKDLFSVMELKFCMYRAHEESLLKSKRLRAVWEKKKKLAVESKIPISRNRPSWLDLRDGAYRIIPDRVEIVRRIVSYAIDRDYGAEQIATIFSKQGVPCFGRKGHWTSAYVHSILTDRALYGAYEPTCRDFETGRPKKTGEIVEGYYPAIISEAKWLALQRGRQERRVSVGRPQQDEANLFTGILYEAGTGQKMRMKYTIDPRLKVRRYYLRTYRGPGKVSVRYECVRDGIVRALGLLQPDDILPEGQEADQRLRQISELTHEVLALADRRAFLEGQQNDPLTDPDLLPSIQKGIVEVVRKHRDKANRLRGLEDEAKTNRTKSLGACQSVLNYLDTPERRRIARTRIRQLVESIWVVVQEVSSKNKIVHVQMYFRGGRRKYCQILSPDLQPRTRVWNLRDCDFRVGDVGDAAPNAVEPSHVVG